MPRSKPLAPPLGDFLSRDEAAALLRKSPETIDKLRKSTRWRRGVHWFQPHGSRPLYSRSALEAWVRDSVRPERRSPLNLDLVR